MRSNSPENRRLTPNPSRESTTKTTSVAAGAGRPPVAVPPTETDQGSVDRGLSTGAQDYVVRNRGDQRGGCIEGGAHGLRYGRPAARHQERDTARDRRREAPPGAAGARALRIRRVR